MTKVGAFRPFLTVAARAGLLWPAWSKTPFFATATLMTSAMLIFAAGRVVTFPKLRPLEHDLEEVLEQLRSLTRDDDRLEGKPDE